MKQALSTSAWDVPQWEQNVDTIEPGRPGKMIRELVRNARRYPAIILNGSLHRDQLAAFVLAQNRHQKIVILDATWKRGNPADYTTMRAGLRILDGPNVHYCVHSRYEQTTFGERWNVDPARVHYTPWCHTVPTEDMQKPVSDAAGIVALGDSLRDWDTLLDAAPLIPHDIWIITRSRLRKLPCNVRADAVTAAEFDGLRRHARVVVVPLQYRTDRSAGHTAFINAMVYGKPVVVTETPFVVEYVNEGGSLVPPNDPEALAWAINRLDDAPLARKMGRDGRRFAVAQLTPERYVDRVLTIVGS